MVALFSNFDYTEQQSQVNHSAAFECVSRRASTAQILLCCFAPWK